MFSMGSTLNVITPQLQVGKKSLKTHLPHSIIEKKEQDRETDRLTQECGKCIQA